MVHAGIAKNLAGIVGTAQSTSHLTEPTRKGETPAGCRPRARGVFTPPLVIMCFLSAIVKEGNDMSWYTHERDMLMKNYEAFISQAFLEDLVLCGW